MSDKKAVLYTTVGAFVIGEEEEWNVENNLEKLNDVFYGAVDVVSLRPAMNGKIGYDAWVKDDAVSTGTASTYRVNFGDELDTVVFLPQGKAIVVLAVLEDGTTQPLTHEEALEVQMNLSVSLWNRGDLNAK
ncbi:hypothetical protein [Weissella cibaria]|uniref:hypothetical protein n=1 Tax=Weissella cibaria TaxID=137591 RepID=UPI001899E9B2|nr:hypothetical protein [Weissella cibaria]